MIRKARVIDKRIISVDQIRLRRTIFVRLKIFQLTYSRAKAGRLMS